MPWPDTIHIVNPMDYRFSWIIYYTNALYQVGAAREAQLWTQRALEICLDDAQHRENLRILAGLLGTSPDDTGEDPGRAGAPGD